MVSMHGGSIHCCKTGTTSSKAAGDLKKQGFTNVNVLSGGMMNWTQSGMPLVKNR